MHGLNCGMLAIKRGRARRAQAGAKAPVLADEQWAEPAVPARYQIRQLTIQPTINM